jgi:hypothetical protein
MSWRSKAVTARTAPVDDEQLGLAALVCQGMRLDPNVPASIQRDIRAKSRPLSGRRLEGRYQAAGSNQFREQ